VSRWLVARAIVAAEAQHVVIADRATRIDVQLDTAFPPEALCQALQLGLPKFAALTGEDCSDLDDHLTRTGLTGDTPPKAAGVPGAIPLARALLRGAEPLTQEQVIYTADEAFWPGTTPVLARMGFRLFMSRLTGIARCAAYASLVAGGNVHITGDQPTAAELERACGALRGRRQPCVIDLYTGMVTGALDKPSDAWTGSGGRLSVASCTHTEEWQVSPDRSITWVSGVCAFPNLSALPHLHQVAEFQALDYIGVSGVDPDPALAKAKCLGEGAERYSAGDIDPSRMVYAPASGLYRPWLDPRRIIAYSAAQRRRIGASEFSPDDHEWWVPGQSHNGPVWIPAALVFYPFASMPSWLAPSAVSSSGMAAHVTLGQALRSAWLELVERDAFQRARLAGTACPPPQIRPQGLPVQARDMVAHLARHAAVRVLLLPSPTGIPVALVRADTAASMAIGAAADEDLGCAVTRAAGEAFIQVLHPFICEIRPESVNSPEDHGALYNSPQWRKKLDWMAQGPTIDPAEVTSVTQVEPGDAACWYELAPELPNLHVVRILDPALIPLTFGYDQDPTGRDDMSALIRASGLSEDQPLEPHAFP
jgi:thiazole/oxazole-forming peptide maturase SagD family component